MSIKIVDAVFEEKGPFSIDGSIVIQSIGHHGIGESNGQRGTYTLENEGLGFVVNRAVLNFAANSNFLIEM